MSLTTESEPLIPLDSRKMTDFEKNLFLTKLVKDLRIEIGILNSELDELKDIQAEKNRIIIEKEKVIKRNGELLRKIKNLELKLDKYHKKQTIKEREETRHNGYLGKTIKFWEQSTLITGIIVGTTKTKLIAKVSNENGNETIKRVKINSSNLVEIK